MCDPLTATVAASTALSFIGQSQQAAAAEASAKQSYATQIAATQLQEQQINANAQDQMSQRASQARAAIANMNVSAGEHGAGGNSTDALNNSVLFNSSQDIATLDSNRQANIKQAQYGMASAQSQAQSQLNTSGAQPNILGAGLQVAGAYYGQKSKASMAGNGTATGGP